MTDPTDAPVSPQALTPAAMRVLLAALVLGVVAITAIVLGTRDDSPATEVAGQIETAPSTVSMTSGSAAGSSTTAVAPIALQPRPAPTTTPSNPPSSTAQPDPTIVAQSGAGTYTYATTPGRTFGDPTSPSLIQFSVAVEDGTDLDPDEIAAFVDLTLADERSWIGFGDQAFERIDEGGLFTLVIATPDTVDELCLPLDTAGRYSCARNGWVAINLDRWMNATEFWDSTRTDYRHYVVNHEIGHYLGVQHVPCPGDGEIAPIMQQQTITLDGCIGNGWPYPDLG